MATQVSLNDGAVASAGALAIQTNGNTQAVSISTGQVATFAQNPILTSGTANGVAYLNGSKVLTTGSALTFDGTNLGLSNSAVATLVKIDGSGRYKQFETYSSGTRQFYIGWDNTSQVANITNDNNYPILFSITGSEQMRLTSTGLGIGTSSPTRQLQVSNASNAIISAINGSIEGVFNVTTTNVNFGSASNHFITLSTNGTERVRIDTSGNLLVGTTAAQLDGSSKMVVLNSSATVAEFTASSGTATQAVLRSWNTATSGDNLFQTFHTDAGATQRGSITYNRTAGLVAYNTTSDYRAKDISGPVNNSGALIDSVPVYMGTMKGAIQERPMFIAHEVPAYAHTGEKDAVDADGNPVYQQMDASALIPVMWAEIQSLRKRLAAAGI